MKYATDNGNNYIATQKLHCTLTGFITEMDRESIS